MERQGDFGETLQAVVKNYAEVLARSAGVMRIHGFFRHSFFFGIVAIGNFWKSKLHYCLFQAVFQGIGFLLCIELAVGYNSARFIKPGDKIEFHFPFWIAWIRDTQEVTNIPLIPISE